MNPEPTEAQQRANTGLNVWFCSCCQQFQVTPANASSETVVNDHLEKCHGPNATFERISETYVATVTSYRTGDTLVLIVRPDGLIIERTVGTI